MAQTREADGTWGVGIYGADVQNCAFQHGILEAGLLCRGQIMRISFPLFPRASAAYREHRLPWNTHAGTQAP